MKRKGQHGAIHTVGALQQVLSFLSWDALALCHFEICWSDLQFGVLNWVVVRISRSVRFPIFEFRAQNDRRTRHNGGKGSGRTLAQF
jgi:hypothetical protein